LERLNLKKLHVKYLANASPEKLALPRRYTLTHSDITGELFLSIGSTYNTRETSKLYTRLMRDEVLAELHKSEAGYIYRIYCHISGGFVFGTAGCRYRIFRSELPLALEAIRFGDRRLFENNPELDHANVNIYMQSNNKSYNKVEDWGSISKYS